MRRLAIGIVALAAIAAVQTTSPETRSFDGTGSLDTSSPVEVYLLEGTYWHRLDGDDGCRISASLFPSRDPQGVILWDVLQADLTVGRTPAVPSGSFSISQEGWARLQLGTGPDCGWTYSISGSFLTVGEEPDPPSERSLLWLQLLAVAGAAFFVVVVALRRRTAEPVEDDESPIRVMD